MRAAAVRHNQREDKFLRATKNYKHFKPETPKHNEPEASRKSRKAVKATSAGVAVFIALAALIVPTTTLAPGVEAYADSRVASYSIGDIDKFSDVITNNCVEETVAAEEEATEPETTVEETTVEETTAPVEETTAPAVVEEKTEKTEKTEKKASSDDSSKSDDYTYDYDEYSYDDYDWYEDSYYYSESSESKSSSSSSSSKSSSSSSSKSSTSSSSKSSTSSNSSSGSSYSGSSSSYSSSALISIANPDYSYTAKHLSLSSYDRAKLERLVMGEAGSMGFNGCAVVAQAIRDSMVRSGTTSIDQIIDEYQYFASTSMQPNSDVKNAVSFIFDQDGIAVQHRVMCFYVGYSAWHETQTFITQIDGVRFFDLNFA